AMHVRWGTCFTRTAAPFFALPEAMAMLMGPPGIACPQHPPLLLVVALLALDQDVRGEQPVVMVNVDLLRCSTQLDRLADQIVAEGAVGHIAEAHRAVGADLAPLDAGVSQLGLGGHRLGLGAGAGLSGGALLF